MEASNQPVFSNEAADVANWPEGAVMAITFTAERFGHLALRPGEELPQTDHYGADGWPVDIPEKIKATLPELLKREFQVQPWGWRQWSAWIWQRARLRPQVFARARAQATVSRELVKLASQLCDD